MCLSFPSSFHFFFHFRRGRAHVRCVDVFFLHADSCVTSGSGLQTSVVGDQRLGSGGFGVIRVGSGGVLAAEGKLGQRHGLVGETLRGQHGERMTVDVPVEGHHARPLRTAKGGVMQLIGQG